MTRNKKILHPLYLLLGFFSVFLGVLGILLPVMPTTIFLIIASFFFARSSERLHKKLLSNKLFGKLISDFYKRHTIPLKAKITSISLLNGSIIYSIIFVANHLYLQLFLFFAAIFITLFLLSLSTEASTAIEVKY